MEGAFHEQSTAFQYTIQQIFVLEGMSNQRFQSIGQIADSIAEVAEQSHASHYLQELLVGIALQYVVLLQLRQEYGQKQMLVFQLVLGKLQLHVLQVTQQYYEEPKKKQNDIKDSVIKLT